MEKLILLLNDNVDASTIDQMFLLRYDPERDSQFWNVGELKSTLKKFYGHENLKPVELQPMTVSEFFENSKADLLHTAIDLVVSPIRDDKGIVIVEMTMLIDKCCEKAIELYSGFKNREAKLREEITDILVDVFPTTEVVTSLGNINSLILEAKL